MGRLLLTVKELVVSDYRKSMKRPGRKIPLSAV